MRTPECHPGGKNQGRGLCTKCYMKWYAEENRERIAAQRHSYYLEHKEERMAYKRRWREENLEERRASRRRYYEANRDERIEYVRQWSAANPDKTAEYTRRKRARRFQSPAILFTPDPIDGKICFYCGDPAEHWDHFTPLSRGGGHLPGNLVPACASCNSSKHARMPEDIMVQLSLGGIN